MVSGKPTVVADLAEIAVAAGVLILGVYARPGAGAASKADGSPVTEADARAEELILSRLGALAPGVPIVSEEAAARGLVPTAGERFFLVDPLDGTKEFLSRNGEFTVNIALIDNGGPTRGVVYLPTQGVLYFGSEQGAMRARVEGRRIGEATPIRARAASADGLDVVASRSHMTPETEAFLRNYNVRSMIQAGSSLKFCRIAEGAADLYPRLARTMQWDTAAGDAVLRAAGGRVLTLDGALLEYGAGSSPDFFNPHFVACGAFDPFAGVRS